MKSAKKIPEKSSNTTQPIGKNCTLFTDAERAAMRARLQERQMEAGRKEDGEHAVLAKIAAIPEPDRAMAERLHPIIRAKAPTLSPKTWYGMPAYAGHQGLNPGWENGDTNCLSVDRSPPVGYRVVKRSVLGGLHHEYGLARAAAWRRMLFLGAAG